MASRKLFILFGLLFFLSTCTSATSPEMVVNVPEKPVVINVGMTSALAQYEGIVTECATDVEVLVDVLPWVRLQDENEDVYLVYGETDKELTEYVYQIGESELVFIIHPDLPIESITINQLRAIFDGEMTDWVEYAITSSYMGEIQLWGMMEDTEIMEAALDAIDFPNPAGQWQVAPTPADVVEMVGQDQNAIGVVPAFAVTDEVRVIGIAGLEFEPVPILAIWKQEPNVEEQKWLQCVQGTMREE